MARLPLAGIGARAGASLAKEKGESAFDKHVATWDACGDLCAEIVTHARRQASGRDRGRSQHSAGLRRGLWTNGDASRGGKDGIARIQAEERARTGINSLKVGYNKVSATSSRSRTATHISFRATISAGRRWPARSDM